MKSFDYDLFVVGAGSAGVRLCRQASSFGAKVAVAEGYRMGGTCVIRGCVPKKLLAYAAHFADDFADARGYGWQLETPSFAWPSLIANKNREISRLEAVYQGMLDKASVKSFSGKATLIDPHTIEVGTHRVSARYIAIATGAAPVRLDIPGADHAITSDEAFELKALPKRIMVVGGGYIAVEFASIFQGLGSQVVVSYRKEEILRGFDADVRRHARLEMAKKGIRFSLNHQVQSIRAQASHLLVDGSDGKTSEVDAIMFATGRKPNIDGLGLDRLGVACKDDGSIIVDAYSKTNIPNLFAIGDVTSRLALTPVAIREGSALAATLFNNQPTAVDHTNVATAVFCSPPVSTVGLTQHDALKHHDSLDIYSTSFRPLKHALTGRDEKTYLKLVVESKTQRVLGAHMVGTDAPEIMQGLAIAVKAGLTKAQFDDATAIHPTAAEEFVTLKDKQTIKRS